VWFNGVGHAAMHASCWCSCGCCRHLKALLVVECVLLVLAQPMAVRCQPVLAPLGLAGKRPGAGCCGAYACLDALADSMHAG
jgi:hypothetical protein